MLSKLIYTYLTNSLICSERTVTLTENNTKLLDEFVKNVMVKKKNESHHIVDSFNEAKRWRTGAGGELALAQYIDKNFVDLTIGKSNDYHIPDLSSIGLNVGIKTVELGKYPIIFKHSEKPEIIIIRIDDEKFCILGIVSKEDLNEYQSDDEILSPSLKARGTKTAFTGLYKIKPFSNYEELMKLI
jgi:hypothetical protein